MERRKIAQDVLKAVSRIKGRQASSRAMRTRESYVTWCCQLGSNSETTHGNTPGSTSGRRGPGSVAEIHILLRRFTWPTTMLARLFTTRANISTKLSSVTEHDLVHFSKILSPTSILSTLPPISNRPEDLAQFNDDWMGRFRGRSTTVLKPKSTHQVSQIMKWCYDKRIGVVPQGGNTGLVGGSVPINDEVVLSLSNMNNVRSFDPVSGPSSLPGCTSISICPRMQVSLSQTLDVYYSL